METLNTYCVNAAWKGGRKGLVSVEGIADPGITFSAPVEFKGESGLWTPEHFLVAAVASCFAVTFFAMAQASRLDFQNLEMSVEGVLTKSNGKLGFAEVVIRPVLTVVLKEDRERGNRLLEKAEQGCLISRSLACPVRMEPLVRVIDEVLV
jgi:peroxiredoxin-like protein